MKAARAPVRATGRCLCGGVRFSIRGPLRETVTACHCRTCRRFSGGVFAATVAHRRHVAFQERRTLRWYRSSTHGRRGFCGRCGASLFWRTVADPWWSIAAGALDQPTGLRLACHGWTSQAADYWSFSTRVPRRRGPSGLGRPRRPGAGAHALTNAAAPRPMG